MNYRSGDISKLCNVNKETLRYYERKGLIHEPVRSDAGYRLYPEETINRIMFIKRIQELGFTLSEIDKLLGVVDKDDVRCAGMNDFVVQKLEDVQSKIRDFQRIETMLKDLKDRCPDEKAIHECPIIEALIDNNQKEKEEVQ
ncbi:Hg(II)-responsive transcriptional regulator [Paenibacillus sp. 11B]|uniref:Mercuric resistance operon regulatory protein n=1 Tax=Paenibacillus urinalis TaxID=521520 RepID=A0AAX3N920_9BACL|nr:MULTISPECIES: Hg(II)-responsive transcriptional regulator [Paenibacillus]MDN8593154.1 Hg(II)-responsive transcriptional regulator [Paenibacillus sp. 11B]WDH85260.1 Hg(II)-responsive transcriptional regulator [Paenibacillus urinalis]